MKRSVATKIMEDVVLVYNSEDPPTAEEWPDYIRLQSQLKLPCLVVTDGGAPNAAQRSDINAHMAGRKIAVITDDKFALAALTALFWFNKSMKGFPSGQWEPALRHIGSRLTPEEAQKEVAKLRDDIQQQKLAG